MKQNKKGPEATDIISLLADMRSGQVAADISNKCNEVLAAVLDTGKKGEVTVKFAFKPSKFALGGAVLEIDITHDVKLKRPELEIGKSTFFVDPNGRLTRDNPDQTAMFEGEESIKGEPRTN